MTFEPCKVTNYSALFFIKCPMMKKVRKDKSSYLNKNDSKYPRRKADMGEILEVLALEHALIGTRKLSTRIHSRKSLYLLIS